MRFCTSCGSQLGIGKFCTNCGARVTSPPEADDATMVRSEPLVPPDPATAGQPPPPLTAPPARPPVQPPPAAVPPAARYPLYADTVVAPTETSPQPVLPDAPPPHSHRAPARRRGSSGLVWLAALAVLVLIVATGGFLLIRDSGNDDPPARDDSAGPADREARDQDDQGDQGGGGGNQGATDRPDVQVPAAAPASVDNEGNPVTFTGTNLLDGDPRTCWRMGGDGTDAVLTFTFPEPVEITSVGLINGYAKTDPPDDWYTANRRVLSVAWVFDDGTEVVQDLTDKRAVQTLDVDPVETGMVQLRLLEVSAPGRGPSGRDYTAISEVSFEGSGG